MIECRLNITKSLPVQSYWGHTTLGDEVFIVFRLYKVFGIEEVFGRCSSCISPQRSDAVEKTCSHEPTGV